MNTQKETWFCTVCLGEISHDAIAVYNPDKEDYDVLGLLDGTWCETCGEDKGNPAFGIPPEKEN